VRQREDLCRDAEVIPQTDECTRTPPAGGTESANRVSEVLLLVLDGSRSWGVTEVSNATLLPKGVVHRILQSLESRGLVRRLPAGRYMLGPQAEALTSYQDRKTRLLGAAATPLRSLQTVSGETVVMSMRHGYSRLGVQQILGSRETTVAMALEQPKSLFTGASGHAILAHSDRHFRERAADWFGHGTDTVGAISSDRKPRWDLIEERGFAISERSGRGQIGAIAAPIIASEIGVVGAVAILCPAHRAQLSKLVRWAPDVATSARAISQAIGIMERNNE